MKNNEDQAMRASTSCRNTSEDQAAKRLVHVAAQQAAEHQVRVVTQVKIKHRSIESCGIAREDQATIALVRSDSHALTL